MFCECRDIAVRRGGAIVLQVDRLAIEAGRITAVVGPNGSGKTTLLEVIALLRHPVRGRMSLWSQPAGWGDRKLRRNVVMVMHPGYMFRGDVWDNMMYGLKVRGLRGVRARARAAEALEMVAMSELAHRSASALSAGERQRVNLARAIAIGPRAILLDEPTANVDAQTLELIARLLRGLRDAQGMTIVYTSPAQVQLAGITDRVVELADGHVRHPTNT